MKKYNLLILVTIVGGLFYLLKDSNTLDMKKPREIFQSLLKTEKNEEIKVDAARFSKKDFKKFRKKIEEDEFLPGEKFKNKIFFSRNEKAEFLDFYSNTRRMNKAYLVLRNKDYIGLKKEYQKHLLALNFLKKSATTTRNPNKDLAMEMLENYLISDLMGQFEDLKDKKLIFADKVEILTLIRKHDPNRFHEIKESYSGSHLSKIFEFMKRINS